MDYTNSEQMVASRNVPESWFDGVITNLEVAEADTNVRLAEENEANLRWRRDLAMLQLRHAAGLLDIPAM